jgi:hypothetical protein
MFCKTQDVVLPQVYSFNLSRLFKRQAVAYSVEYFCSDNLFVPFPAVMINHYGDGFVNTVHAYNRVLNDVFEDDAINAHHVAEASIDVEVNEKRDTFVIFQAGQFACNGTVGFELTINGEIYSIEKLISVPRFCSRQFLLSEMFALNEIKGEFLESGNRDRASFLVVCWQDRKTCSRPPSRLIIVTTTLPTSKSTGLKVPRRSVATLFSRISRIGFESIPSNRPVGSQ